MELVIGALGGGIAGEQNKAPFLMAGNSGDVLLQQALTNLHSSGHKQMREFRLQEQWQTGTVRQIFYPL